uniref:Putative PKD domain protein n=1 Tax=uncultured marine microorganism HF4000_ANIW137J11 TaxID=455532 RepID=B3T4Q7_9ZZZZ|nr:putative PKD domain protein [uncultured marine microorganism HF4000_ANIW137J11]
MPDENPIGILIYGPRLGRPPGFQSGVIIMTQQRHSLKALLATALLISGALAGLMLAREASGETYGRDGFVLTDSAGLAGATVTAFNTATGAVTTATTFEDGWYGLDDLEDGDYKFGYEMAGYLTVVNDIAVDDGGSMDYVILVATIGGNGSLAGNVTNGTSAIEGASVTLAGEQAGDGWWGGSAAYERSATTDAGGNFSFSGLANESFTLRVTASGYYSSIVSAGNVVLSAVNNDNLKYVRILDGDGNTLRDAEVMLYEASTATWTVAGKLGGATHVVRPSTAANGNYIFAFHEDYATSVIVAGDGAGENLEIVLDSASSGTRVAALPDVPAVTSNIPVMDVSGMAVLLQLNPGPTADIQITSETTLFDGVHVVALDEEVSFSGAGSSAVIGLTQYEWTFGDTSTYGTEINHTWDAAGSYTVNLTVMDQYNAVNTTSLVVLVDGSAPAPAFDILVKGAIASADPGEPYNGTNVDELLADDDATGSTLVFNGSGSSDAESHITSWEWDFGDNTTNSGEVVNKQYLDPGDYPVSLTATDAAGNSASVMQTVHVNDITRPAPAFTYYEAGSDSFNESAVEGLPTTFNANLTQDNYDSHEELTFQWEFGDGSNGSGMQVDHIYEDVPDEGYDVLLTVIDRAGNSEMAVRTVPVGQQQRPDLSISRINFSNDAPTEGGSILISADLKLHNENITQNFTVSFYYDLVDAEHLIANVTVDSSVLVAGIENTHIVDATWSNLPSGTHTVIVVADSGNVIEEQKEDNQAIKSLTVAVSDEGRDWPSIALIVAVVAATFGALGYIYRDRIFGS